MEVSFRSVFAEYLCAVAAWRRRRYDDDLRDSRNLRSADALEGFAAFVTSLPEDDARLRRLEQLTLRGATIDPGQQTSYEIGRYRFYTAEATDEGFLDRLIELAEADRGEFGRFGGRQVPGDEPW